MLYTLQLKMAQYRARAKAGWEASASARAEQSADKTAGAGRAAGGAGDDETPENRQALTAREEENQVHARTRESMRTQLAPPVEV